MKLEKISIAIGTVISAVFTWVSLEYFKYKETPAIQRTYRPAMETIESLELRFNDLKYKFKSPQDPDAPVALIAVDDDSLREIGRWPWSRQHIAEITDKVIQLGAKSIAFDAIFSEPEKGSEAADPAFAAVVEKNPEKVILGTFSENKVDYKSYQDLCVAEAFSRTGGDQLAKINPGFSIDEIGNEIDELNWAPLFELLFQNIQENEMDLVLKDLGKSKLEDLTEFQKNYLNSRKSRALFEYCQLWLTPADPFLVPELVGTVTPMYLNLIKESSNLKNLSFDQFKSKIITSFKPHPIPEYGEWTGNIPLLQNPAQYTASFIAELDSDGYVRRYPLFFRSGNKLGTSFIPSLALQSFLASGPYRAEVKMKVSSKNFKSIDEFNIYDTSTTPEKKISTYPVDKSGQMLINFYGRQMSFPYVPAKEFLNDRPTVRVFKNVINSKTNQVQIVSKEYKKSDFFRGKSLIFGATAVGVYDLRNTPIEANYPGPELHLTMLANLIKNDFLKSWAKESEYMPWIIFCTGILFTLMFSHFPPIPSFLLFNISIAVFMFADVWLFLKEKILLNSFLFFMSSAITYFSIQVYRFFTEERKKRELRSTFSKYVSPAVVDELLRDAENLKLGGRREHMTAFFSDVRGFTTISEKLTPEELSRVLNLYLTPMTEIVFKNEGTLDKYMGDAIMAFFGAPVPHKKHAEHACRCALQSIEKLKVIQKEFEEKNIPRIDIGIGINTGPMSVGNMGSNIVQNYTIMGDAVNLASRLEGINKEYGTRIIISEFTYAEVKDLFIAREVDRVRVKGKLEPVRIFELIGEGGPDASVAQWLPIYLRGLEEYQKMKFSAAIESFKKVKAIYSEDPVSELYIERCQDYLDNPPPETWDGVYVMKTK